jgi:hypothetical protein
MNRSLVLTIVFLFFSYWVNAVNITGVVKDGQGSVVAGANIVLLKEDGKTLVVAELSDDNGAFTFAQVADGSYFIKALFIGFEDHVSDKITIAGADVNLSSIELISKHHALGEVSVRAQKPFIEVQADKIVVNVENSIVSAGSSVLEVLGRSPGVRVDQSDNISLKGKAGVTIMIDGKITPMSGADLVNVLKSMPASTIDRIELISNPSSRYDAAGTAGIISIRTKKDQRIGLNGSYNVAYGQGVYPKLNTGINLNYRNKKLNVYLNYSYAYRLWFNHLMLNRRFYNSTTNDLLFIYDQDNYAVYDFKNHIASSGLDYSFTKHTTQACLSVRALIISIPKRITHQKRLAPIRKHSSCSIHKAGIRTHSATSLLMPI